MSDPAGPTLPQRLSRTPWPGIAASVSGLALITALVATGDGNPDTPAAWYVLPLLVTAVPTLVVGVLLLIRWNDRRALTRDAVSRSRQVHELKAALDKAVGIVTAFRDEIAERDRLLRELEDKVENRRALAKLTASEVDAVVNQLRSELRREGRRGLIRDVFLGLIFFGAGAAFTYFAG